MPPVCVGQVAGPGDHLGGPVTGVRRLVTEAAGPGARLRIFCIAPEGFIMRRAGPNGRRLVDEHVPRDVNDLSTPHGACILPGEDHAERLFVALDEAMNAIGRRDAASLRAATGRHHGRPSPTTEPLTLAMAAMSRLLHEAHADAETLAAGGDGAERFRAEARAAMRRVVRQSIEMRAVGWLRRD